jgi:hypothetical protein
MLFYFILFYLFVRYGGAIALQSTLWFWTVDGWMYEFATDLFNATEGWFYFPSLPICFVYSFFSTNGSVHELGLARAMAMSRRSRKLFC